MASTIVPGNFASVSRLGGFSNPILSDVVVEGQRLVQDGPDGSEVLRALMRHTVFPFTDDTTFLTVETPPENNGTDPPNSPSRNVGYASFEAPASPMSVASTVPADYDPMMARQEL